MEARSSRDVLPKLVFFTFLAALLVRAVYFLEHSGAPTFAVPMLDQLYYHLFAQAIMQGDDLRQFDGFRPMLYPAFVAFFYWMGGSAGTVLTILAQHVMGAATAAMVAVLAWLLSGRRVLAGIAAGGLCAVAAPLIYYEGELLIETLMPFLVSVMLLLIGVAVNREGARAVGWWLAAGAVAGLAVQARPNILLFFPTFGIVPLWLAWREKTRKPLVMLAAIPAILLVLMVFGHLNKMQSGRFQPVTSSGGINFYLGNNARADGAIPRMPHSTSYQGGYRDSVAVFSEMEYARAMSDEGKTPSTDPGVISDYWYNRTWQDIGENPARWAGLMLKKVALTLGNYEISNGESFAFAAREESLLLRLLPGRWVVLMFLFPAGLWAVWKFGDRRLLAFLVLFLVLYALSFIMYFVNARFRIPLWPAALALAGCGGEMIVRLLLEKGLPGARRLLAIGAVFAAASLAFNALVPPETLAFSYFFRSIANYQIGDYEAARHDIQLSARLEPPVPDVVMQMANVEFALGNYEEALKHYRESVRLEPYEPRSLNNLGATYEKMGRYQEAYDTYLAALKLSPTHQTSLVNIAFLALRAGRIAEAEARLELARTAPSQGNPIPLKVAQALLLAAKGDTEAASRQLDEAARTQPRQVESLVEDYGRKIELAEAQTE